MSIIQILYVSNGQLRGCLDGSVKIPLLDGTTPTIKELYDMYKDNPRNNGKDTINYLYSYDFNTNKFTVGELVRVFFTGIKDVYELTLDTGKKIICTADHPFLDKNKHWRTLRNGLNVGDSLMSFRRENNDGYEMLVFQENGKIDKQYTHRMVINYKDGISENNKKYEGHHKDGNPFNNTPSNLCGLTKTQHKSYHTKLNWKNNAYFRKCARNALKPLNTSSEKQRERSLRRWDKYKTKEERVKHLKEIGCKTFSSEYNSTQHPNLIKIPLDEFLEYAKTCFAGWQICEHFKISGSGYTGYCRRHNLDKTKILRQESYKISGNGYTHVCDNLLNKLNTEYRKVGALSLQECLDLCINNSERNLVNRWYNDNMLDYLISTYNHKIISIKHLGKRPTYDLTVRGHHNFALDCGLISKNSTGTGKSTVATYSLCYELYKLMCLKNPNRYYLGANETIWFLFFNLNLKLAEKTMWR